MALPPLSALALTLERAARSGEADLAWGTLPDFLAVAEETLALLYRRCGGHPDVAGAGASAAGSQQP